MTVKNKNVVSEVRIRNVDAAAIARIDQLAAKAGKKRNTYLKEYIETLSILNQLNEQEEKYQSLVNNILNVLTENTKQIRLLRNTIESELSSDEQR